MRKSARKLASVVLLAAGLTVAPLFIAGCESRQEQANADASKKVAKAEADRAIAEKDKTLSNNPKLLDAVQGEYDTLGADSTVSPDMKAVLKGRQAQVRYERALNMIANLRDKELAIIRHISAIDQMASQIEGSQKYIKALQSYDPTAANAALKARQIEIDTGDEWKMAAHTPDAPTAELAFPTVAKLQSTIDDLTAKIAKAKGDMEGLRKKSAELTDQAETITRKAETETGDALVADQTRASDARKQASLTDAQADSTNTEIGHLQGDLDLAQAQKAAVANTSQTFSKQTEISQTAWEAVQNQVTAEKKMQQMLIAGGWEAQAGSTPDAHPSSISAEAAALAVDLRDAASIRKTVEDELAKCVKQFAGAATDAQSVRSALLAKVRERATDADVPVWKQQMETLHPAYFTLGQAAAQTSMASVAANDAAILSMLQQMFDGYAVGPELVAAPLKALNVSMDAPSAPTQIAGLTSLLTSENTGIEMPKELGEVTKPSKDDVTRAISAADVKFEEAMKIYDQSPAAADSGLSAKERSDAILAGKALAQRLWGNFDLMVGLTDVASRRLKAADALDAQLPPRPAAPGDTTQSPASSPPLPAAGAPPVAPAIPPAAPMNAPTPAGSATPGAPAVPGTVPSVQ